MATGFSLKAVALSALLAVLATPALAAATPAPDSANAGNPVDCMTAADRQS